ncbi:succinate--CoA ligase subunit alpha [candidate division KSB1 bacterium]|nr:succinate--CoA ligase subunit alpha [candidate division KSB1 bacterium]
MGILINKSSCILVQGITGREGLFHTRHMLEYGTRIVAGVTPGKGGTFVDNNIPVYNSVAEAVEKHRVDVSIVFVPAPFAKDALLEAMDGGIQFIVCITEGIPQLDMLQVLHYAGCRNTQILGPNTPGIIIPGQNKIGIMPGDIHKPGRIGVVSRSGTLTYEAVAQLTHAGFGQSTVIGIGGDSLIGIDFVRILELFQADPGTDAVVLIGEIGGFLEEKAANYIKTKMTKPVLGYIAGHTAPQGRRMGHAGAIIASGENSALQKSRILQDAGAVICQNISEFGEKMKEVFKTEGANDSD